MGRSAGEWLERMERPLCFDLLPCNSKILLTSWEKSCQSWWNKPFCFNLLIMTCIRTRAATKKSLLIPQMLQSQARFVRDHMSFLIQEMVDEGKRAEWQTMLSKPNAVRVRCRAAARIKAERPDRFIGSHLALTRKPIEEGKEVNPLDLGSLWKEDGACRVTWIQISRLKLKKACRSHPL